MRCLGRESLHKPRQEAEFADIRGADRELASGSCGIERRLGQNITVNNRQDFLDRLPQ